MRIFKAKEPPAPKCKQTGGLYIGMLGDEMYLSCDDVHCLMLAPTRVGKTRGVLIPMIAVLAQYDESMIIFDPKGELFGYLSPYLRAIGVQVNRIDFSDPLAGNRWNPLYLAIEAYERIYTDPKTGGSRNLFKEVDVLRSKLKGRGQPGQVEELAAVEAELEGNLETADREIKRVLHTVFPREPEKETSGSAFFNAGAENAMLMTLHYLCSSANCPREAKTLRTASQVMADYCTPVPLRPGNRNDKRVFTPLVELVYRLPIRHPAYGYMKKIESSGDYLKDFCSTAQGVLAKYTSSTTAKMMRDTDFPLEGLCDARTATFVIVPSYEDTYTPLAQLYIDQAYSLLMRRASERGGRLARRMTIFGEEFKQLPPFQSMDERLSISAGSGIRWVLVLQSLTQLQAAYRRDNAATILQNCQVHIYLRAGDAETGKYISEKCGTYTIEVKNTSTSRAVGTVMSDRTNQSTSVMRRERISAGEAQKWDPSQGAIVCVQGCDPAILSLPRLENTPFNAWLGMGDKEHNRRLSEAARALRSHPEAQLVPFWSPELDNGKLASAQHTDEELKALRQKLLKGLLKASFLRQAQGKEAQEDKAPDANATGGSGKAQAEPESEPPVN